MKITKYLILVVLVLLVSCDNSSKPDSLNCQSLAQGIAIQDSELVKSEINKLTTDLEPKITNNDKFEHEENLSTLVNRINSQCQIISAELGCYACIFTNPPQSEILVTTDSAGISVTRIIDILTPADQNLSFIGIH